MATVEANGLRIEYDCLGPPAAPPVLLIGGLGAQLIDWPEAFCERLVGHGLRMIRFDNRDAGLSSHFDDDPAPILAQVAVEMALGRHPSVPYTLSDMADDAVGLLEALGIGRAHIVGRSMGGMIAQLVASRHPERTASLVSLMATTGNPALPPPTPEAVAGLGQTPPDPRRDPEGYLAQRMRRARANSGTAYAFDAPAWRAQMLASLRRAYDAAGIGRQMAATLADGDRRARLRRITAPTLVIHGNADLLLPLAGGEDTAACVRGAELLVVDGMGHEIPPQFWLVIADAIARHVAAAQAAG
ncbi:MAG TPA: alpha/beta hydrolase [Acetobacteraceae bacterium]|jgi:pimeloyl-ACP methyl ester carboxylesterase|nr:alpha/beta hydrolase [Acetobacteraceae bacterium]